MEELYAQFPRLNPAVWHPLVGLGTDPDFPLLEVRSDDHGAPPDASLVPSDAKVVLPRGNPDFALPFALEYEDYVGFPEQVRAGASPLQLEKAVAMHRLGLRSKARRQASCRVYARVRSCENGHQHYQRYGCKNRYCPNESCGRKAFVELFEKYMGLDAVARHMVPAWENRPHRKPRAGDFVIAKIDITIRSLGRMPTNEEVRQFNSHIRKLFRAMAKEFGLTHPKRVKAGNHLVAQRDPHPGDYGVIWTDEFGGKLTRHGKAGNTNLHAHAIYAGPFIPQRWLSARWEMIRSDGSKIVSIKLARTFRAGLYHALKYAGKFLSTDPNRLAELEFAFNRVRRVHAMGAFYNAIPKDSPPKAASPPCPVCGGEMFEASGPLRPVDYFELRNIPDFEVIRRQVARQRVLDGSP
jgi:hypothetical protein